MSAPAEKQLQKVRSNVLPLDWPALALFFLLATAFWIPPLPTSFWSLPAVLRVVWLSVLLVASYLVLFRRKAKRE
jgi:hypothetical protein